MERAELVAIDDSIRIDGEQCCIQRRVHGPHGGFIEESAGDAALVADSDDDESQSFGPRHRRRRAVDQTDL